MTTRANDGSELPAGLKAALDEHLTNLRGQITDRAEEIANEKVSPVDEERVQIDLSSLNQAINELIKGHPPSKTLIAKPHITDWLPPFTIVCSILCLAFATLGLFPLYAGPTIAAKATPVTGGFLDIAKIFAGAIVGSTSSVALQTIRSRRSK